MVTLCTFLLTFGADPLPKETGTPRKPHPLAPSLSLLTDDEEKKLDTIIDRFILADTGKLDGGGAKKAMDDFKKLDEDSFFALIRGFNKSAPIDHSCPALTIGRKLASILRTSDDVSLLQYAKENIGAGVSKTQHGDVIRSLKSSCSQRINSLKSRPLPGVRNSMKP
ncbi:MAG: hypothetical protein K8T89_09080 [Planctomycetes bacterium]|nr:hypothetical protein [Planctomycetota bacterium]